jgi:hypothetical protein
MIASELAVTIEFLRRLAERALEHLGPSAAVLAQASTVRALHAFGQTDLASTRATHRKLEQ